MRRLYRKLKKRAAKTAPGRWLRHVRKQYRYRRDTRRNWPRILILDEAGKPYFYTEWIDWTAHHDPELHALVHLDTLPCEFYPGTALLHAWVQDPVAERNPELHAQLQLVELAAAAAGAQVIHPSRVLSHSLRDEQFERLARAGLRTPRVVDVTRGFATGLGGLTLPIVVRKNWGHCMALTRIDTQEQLAEWLGAQERTTGQWVATEYIETAGPDGLYRKYRYMLFGEHGVCRHLIISPNWEVRPKDRVLTDETIAEELRFVRSPCEHHDILDAARRELEFDIAAFDYSFDEHGEMIVWEVNPYPDLSTPRTAPASTSPTRSSRPTKRSPPCTATDCRPPVRLCAPSLRLATDRGSGEHRCGRELALDAARDVPYAPHQRDVRRLHGARLVVEHVVLEADAGAVAHHDAKRVHVEL